MKRRPIESHPLPGMAQMIDALAEHAAAYSGAELDGAFKPSSGTQVATRLMIIDKREQ